jgi:hypothetical protein
MPIEAARRARIDAAYLRTLRRAVEIAGGQAALATAWGVGCEKLGSWLAGEVVLPVDYYVRALAIVNSRGEAWRTAKSR